MIRENIEILKYVTITIFNMNSAYLFIYIDIYQR